MLNIDEARGIAEHLVDRARKAGADAADAIYAGSGATSVEVRLGELEQVNRSEAEEVGLRLFVGRRSASVSTSDFSLEAQRELVVRALAMAREAPEDPFAGLAPEERLQRGPLPQVDPEDRADPDPAALRRLALEAERSALAVPTVSNSSGASAGTSAGAVALATSDGFSGAYRSTGYSCSASVIAGSGKGMQRDHAWHSARHFGDVEPAEEIGRLAGERAAARVGSVKPKPGRYPVLFDPRVAGSLLGHLAGAIAGASIARGTSFLQARLGARVFAPGVSIIDDPLRPRGLRSRPFDGEGLAVAPSAVVDDGVLTTWLADSASARQLGIEPTGHAQRGVGGAPSAGPSNFYIAAGRRSREALLRAHPTAILVTELIGQGVNGVTGDYSRGAAGFMVRDGEIAEPLTEMTIASNLIDMFASLEPASDLEFRCGIDAPTLLVPEMAVAAG